MLILNEREMRSVVTCEEIMTAVERAFLLYAQNECEMVDRFSARFGGDTMLYMPCRADGVIGTKILAEFPENPSRGLPYLSGVMLLNEAKTGAVKAVMNGQVLTALRTGAIGGLAMRYFAPEEARTVGIVGCGVQGLHQALFALTEKQVETIFVYNHGKKDYAVFFQQLKQLAGHEDFRWEICQSADEVLDKSEIVITATQSRAPLFRNDPEAFRDKCLIAIGSWQPFMREIPDAVFLAADQIVTDLPLALEESGDFTQPLQNGVLDKRRVEFFGDILLRVQKGEALLKADTCFYKSVGMGVLDIVTANLICRKAMEKNLGQHL